MSLDGGAPVRLTSVPGRDAHADFSPDGRTILFSAKAGDSSRIFTVWVDGSALTRLGRGP